MDTSLSTQLDRIKALLQLNEADLSSVLQVLEEYHSVLQHTFPDLPHPNTRFLELRKELFLKSIEQIEEADPGLAGRIQDLIDTHLTNYPISYEDK
jgi:hypothetical protein